MVERLHKIVADVSRAQLACHHKNDDPISDMLQAAAHGVRSTVHGTTGRTPGQLACNKDVTLRTHVEADLELVRQRRCRAAEKNDKRENEKRITFRHKPSMKTLVLPQHMDPKMKTNEGHCKVVNCNEANGTLQMLRNDHVKPINV